MWGCQETKATYNVRSIKEKKQKIANHEGKGIDALFQKIVNSYGAQISDLDLSVVLATAERFVVFPGIYTFYTSHTLFMCFSQHQKSNEKEVTLPVLQIRKLRPRNVKPSDPARCLCSVLLSHTTAPTFRHGVEF